MNPLESFIQKRKLKPVAKEYTEIKLVLPESTKDIDLLSLDEQDKDVSNDNVKGKISVTIVDERTKGKKYDRELLNTRISKKKMEQKYFKNMGNEGNIEPSKEPEAIMENDNKKAPKAKKLKKKIILKIGDTEKAEKDEDENENENQEDKPQKKTRIVRKTKGISNIPLEEWLSINNQPIVERLPPKSAKLNIKVSSYIMNNREIYVNFINSLFNEYRNELMSDKKQITCDELGKGGQDFSLLTHQKIVRDYLNLYTPYRGLLLYHGLGSGKTCTSIAIAEGIKSDKKVIVMTPASLRRNYMEELKKCGDSLYNKTQKWDWISTKKNPELIDTLSAALSLSVEYIKKKQGAWVVDYKSKTNNVLDSVEQNSLDEQLDEMIQTKYNFINYNGLRREKLKTMTNNFEKNIFDNTVVIIDEAHNFISRIVNKISKEKGVTYDNKGEKERFPYALSLVLYEMLMSAENVRIVFLTGTPMINYPNEIGILFNMLRGYVKTWEIPIETTGSHSSVQDKLFNALSREKNTDYIEYSKNKVLSITRNPFGFENKYSKKDGYVGVTNQTGKNDSADKEIGMISDSDYERRIISILKNNDINVNRNGIRVQLFKALPDKLDDFVNMFIDANGSLENTELFKRRIIGLTSYFRSAQEGLLPSYDSLTDLHVEKIPMSNYQFTIYEEARKHERKSEKPKKQAKVDKDGIYSEPSSTYRIFSRLYCNFVMPKPPGRPLPINDNAEEAYNELQKEAKKKGTNDLTGDWDGEKEGDEMIDILGDVSYSKRIESAITFIKENESEVLSDQGLEKYSPKYLAMLKNIINPENIGLHLVYSQFRTLEGIGIFKMVLEYNGFTQFKIKKDSSGVWKLDIKEEDLGKPTFALYTGTESSEEKEAIRNIYNGNWDENSPITQELREISNNNNMGEIIKVLMITASGSEGINLRNTRYVHIMEPYWHPVRTEQVIGRARRICSHKELPEALQTVEVFMYLMTFTEEQKDSDESIELKRKDMGKTVKYPLTSDEYLYEISTIKQQVNASLTTAIKETSIDCAIYSKRGSGETLNCLQFGEPSPDVYAYVPDYKKEQKDTTAQINKRVIQWSGTEIELRGTKYIQRKISENKGTLYDAESYYQSLENPNVQPVPVAQYEITNKGMVIKKMAI